MAESGTIERAIEVAVEHAKKLNTTVYVLAGFKGSFIVCESGHGDREDAYIIVTADGNWGEGPKAKELPIGFTGLRHDDDDRLPPPSAGGEKLLSQLLGTGDEA